MKLLRQSTAASVLLGAFVDDADGKTPETAINAAATDVDIYKGVTKTDITDTDSGGANDFAHVANGYYSLELTVADTDTLGRFRVAVNATGALPVWEDFTVVPAAVYDALIAGTGAGVRSEVQNKTGYSLATAPPTAAEVVTALKADADWDKLFAVSQGNRTITYPASFPGAGTLVLETAAGDIEYDVTFNADGRPTAMTLAS